MLTVGRWWSLPVLLLVACAHDALPGASSAQKSSLGTLKGSSTCGKKLGVEFRFAQATPVKNGLSLTGEYRTYDLPGGGRDPELESPIVGLLDTTTGVLQVQSTVPAPSSSGGQVSGSLFEIGQKIFAKSPEQKAALAQASKFIAVLGRDPAGNGWQGTIANPSFDCPEITLRQEDGHGTGDLPPVSADVAYAQSEFLMKSGSPESVGSSHVYWLKVAAAKGHRDANAYLGRTYDLGEGAPQDFAQAARYYRVAADQGDSRAQAALSVLYGQCKGVSCDAAESKRLAGLARATKVAASKVCTAGSSLSAFRELMLASMTDPTAQFAQLALAMFAELRMSSGSLQVVSVAEHAVSSIDRPFLCEVTAKRIGVTVESIKPDFSVVETYDDGDVLVHDQRFEAGVSRALAAGATRMGAAAPWIQPFRVQPLGERRYQLTMQPQMFGLSREYTSVVDLDKPEPVTPRLVPAAMVPTTARPPAARASKTQTSADGANFAPEIDGGFVQWSGSWSTDKYVPESVQIEKKDCSQDRCAVTGQFSFFRFGQKLTIPFDAIFQLNGKDHTLVRLCYTDTTSAQRDCAE